jgi:hypothetical protein
VCGLGRGRVQAGRWQAVLLCCVLFQKGMCALSHEGDCSVYASLWIAMCVLALCAHPCTWLRSPVAAVSRICWCECLLMALR